MKSKKKITDKQMLDWVEKNQASVYLDNRKIYDLPDRWEIFWHAKNKSNNASGLPLRAVIRKAMKP